MLDAAEADSRLQARRLVDFRTFTILLVFETRFFQAPLDATVADLRLHAQRPGDSPNRLNLTSILLNWHTMPIKFKRAQYAHTQCCTH